MIPHAHQLETGNSARRHSNRICLVDPSVGDDFNHDLHEAVMQVPRANVPDLSPNQIAFIQKTGYVLEDQILRPCWVGVVAE